MAGQGAWNYPQCHPENRQPEEVCTDERNPFVPIGGDGPCRSSAQRKGYNYALYADKHEGEQIDTKEAYQTGQTSHPERSCSGNCQSSTGDTKRQNEDTQSTGQKESLTIKCEFKSLGVRCECDDKDGKTRKWTQQCQDTTVEINVEAEVFSETWDEVNDVTYNCTHPKGCNCGETVTVTTSWAREYCVVPNFDAPDSIPGCECAGQPPPEKPCPAPCKPVEHNYGGTCKGCGGYHGPEPVEHNYGGTCKGCGGYHGP